MSQSTHSNTQTCPNDQTIICCGTDLDCCTNGTGFSLAQTTAFGGIGFIKVPGQTDIGSNSSSSASAAATSSAGSARSAGPVTVTVKESGKTVTVTMGVATCASGAERRDRGRVRGWGWVGVGVGLIMGTTMYWFS